MHWFLKVIFGMKLYMFRTVPLSIIRSFSLYTLQWYMSNRFAYSLEAGSGWSCLQAVSKPVWHIPLQCVQWKTNDGQRNCPKHVEFHSKNNFEKSVHLVGLIIRNLSRCTVTWTSKNIGPCAIFLRLRLQTSHSALSKPFLTCLVTYFSMMQYYLAITEFF